MKPLARRFLLGATLIGALFNALTGSAQGEPASCPPTPTPLTAEQVKAAIKTKQDHGFLWRLRKDGRDSWLYGTIHVARREWMFPGPTVTKAFEASDTIALELNLLDPEILRRMTQGAAQTATVLPEGLKQRLQRQAEAACLPPRTIEGMSPEMQVATLESLIGRRDGLDPNYGIDIVLAGWASGTHRPIVSLETPETQLEALTMSTPAEAIEYVDTSLAEMESGKAAPALKQIAEVWADGDLNRLQHYEDWCDCTKKPADRAALTRLLDDRNPGLADGITALHDSGQHVFAAVGSLHMIGPTGLPALLAQRGFDVQPIAFPAR